jgi:alpha-L-fucosidase
MNSINKKISKVKQRNQKFSPTWQSLDSRPIPNWFGDAKFGIFIHWGVYSVPSYREIRDGLYASYAEWYYSNIQNITEFSGQEFHKKCFGENFEYREFADRFKAEFFEPDQWATIFKDAGAKYVVLTTKHHDGFCLWPTKLACKKNWNSADIGPKRDLVGELTEAVRKKGMKMGLYHSMIEWETHPSARNDKGGNEESGMGYFISEDLVSKYGLDINSYTQNTLLPMLEELVKTYQPSLIFSDGGEWDFDEDYFQTKEFLSWLYNEAPNKDEVVVNDRWCKDMPGKHGDYFSSEYEDTDAIGPGHPWEESRGIGVSYGYNRAENLCDYSSPEELIVELIDIVSRGGNFLLNVGPTADGRLPVYQQFVLKEIGQWLSINGEAIYETLSFKKNDKETGIFFTRKSKDLFLIVKKWPKAEGIVVEFENEIDLELNKINISILGLAFKKINFEFSKNDLRLIIYPPNIQPNELPCRHAFTFKITGLLK